MAEKWSTMVKNGRKKKLEGIENTVNPKPPPTKEQLLWKRRPRQVAVIVASKMKGGKYADIFQKAKSLVSPQEFGLQVAKTRYTGKGKMLLELKGLRRKMVTS